jgi:hypothetical protein
MTIMTNISFNTYTPPHLDKRLFYHTNTHIIHIISMFIRALKTLNNNNPHFNIKI